MLSSIFLSIIPSRSNIKDVIKYIPQDNILNFLDECQIYIDDNNFSELIMQLPTNKRTPFTNRFKYYIKHHKQRLID
jgi:hypothetical protein